MQLNYPWLDSFVSKNQQRTINEITKIERLADKCTIKIFGGGGGGGGKQG